ncbi:hypothetical protein [Pedobacter sp. Leaf194]|uniref:hypothetical protein n=1 Tax=Pedobacter sp. Leaf194 TaxID=1736297 RepID=UPI00070336B0|nr:hypothetical protein [Pedobacter sp. Leaf194]KQS41762.1 hypothetical protein ASG14_04745 [Pedobacter sp. Leaf194]
MDTFKDFFADLKDRISNPFISSFVIGWVIFNYPIIVALLFYKQTELKVDGYTSYLNIIENCRNDNNMLWHPLLVAIMYTFLVPFFKSGVRIFNSWLLTSTDGIVYSMTKNKVVSVELHTKVSSDLEEVKSRYVESIAKESVYKDQNTALLSRIDDLNALQNEIVSKLNADHDNQLKAILEENETRVKNLVEDHRISQSNTSARLFTSETNQTKAEEELRKFKALVKQGLYDLAGLAVYNSDGTMTPEFVGRTSKMLKDLTELSNGQT